MTLYVTPDLDAGPVTGSSVRGRLTHQIRGFDLERLGELARGVQRGRAAGLETPQRSHADVGPLGELLLVERTPRAPVAQAGQPHGCHTRGQARKRTGDARILSGAEHCGQFTTHLSFTCPSHFVYPSCVKVFAALVLGVVVALCAATPATAQQSGPSAFATQHAIEEMVNACAQRKPECRPTSTPSPTPTLTAVPTSTPGSTETPTPEPTATPSPELCWLRDQDLGDPDNGYVVFDELGEPVPCPPDQPLPAEEPTPEPEPRAVAAETPAAVRPVPGPVSVASQPVAAVAPRPTYTPYPTYTPFPTPTPPPTSTANSTASPTATRTPTPAATVLATHTPTATSTAGVMASAFSGPTQARPLPDWQWAAFLGYLAAAIGIVALIVAVLLHRRVAVWKGQPHA